MKRQNRTLIILAIWALVFVNMAFLIALRAKNEAAGEPEVYRVSETSASETAEPEATEVAHTQDSPERDEVAEDCSVGGSSTDSTSEPSTEAESDCTGEPLKDSDAEGASTAAFSTSDVPLPSREAALPGTPSPDGEGLGGETESIDGAAPVFPYTEQDVHDLAVAVYLEAGNASERAKLLVANVVINHVASPEFPNTIHGVLTVPYHYGTMAWDGVEFPENADPALVEVCIEIARRILDGERLCPANVIGQAEFIQGTGIFEYIDGIYFCYS